MAARFLPPKLIHLSHGPRFLSSFSPRSILAPIFSRPAVKVRAMSAQMHSRPGELALGTELHGESGCLYRLTEVLSLRERPFICVYLARDSNERKYVLKTIFKSEFEYQMSLQKPLSVCPNLRVLIDSVPQHLLFVYEYMADDLLRLSLRDLSTVSRKRILRDALTGLAELHDRGIVHTDIKPNNILVDFEEGPDGIQVKQVKLSDLENSACPPPGKSIKGPLLGNHMWRSPEAHVRAKVHTPADIFSFGVVCIYVMLKMVLFQLPDNFPSATDPVPFVLERQFSYFGDGPGVAGLIEHVGPDSPWQEAFTEIMSRLIEKGNPPRPFVGWQDVEDAGFKDVVGRMTRLDPKQRITAREALEHAWFRDAL